METRCTFDICYRKKFQTVQRHVVIPGCTGPDQAIKTLLLMAEIEGTSIRDIVSIELVGLDTVTNNKEGKTNGKGRTNGKIRSRTSGRESRS